MMRCLGIISVLYKQNTAYEMRISYWSFRRVLFRSADFVNRHAKSKNRSWQETARLLGLRPDPDTDGELKPIKGGLADNKKWGARRVQEIARRDIRELIDGIEERGAPVAANRTLAAVRKMFH